MQTLKNKNIVITGGANGIGLALGKYCAFLGARVFSFDLHTPNEPEDSVIYLPVDVTDERAVQRALGAVDHPIHVLVNNAGIMHRGDLFATHDAEWDALFDVNLKAQWVVVKYADRYMTKHPVVMNVASRHGVRLPVNPAVYALTKAGVILFSKLLQKTRSVWQVKVACLGPVDTALHGYQAKKGQLARERKKGIICSAEDMAKKLAMFITSKKTQLLFDPKTCRYHRK